MNVEFKINGSQKVTVIEDKVSGVVVVTQFDGACYEHRDEGKPWPSPEGPCPEVKAHPLVLSKPEARAIASAIMGCAAAL